ncbi:MAG: amylo-alpha-1,6-glucosidase, partial [Bacteroidota bacterium]
SILRSFAEWQERNPASRNFGRIPNLVTTASHVYNTTDGTPWFVIALGDYVRYSGDMNFGREMFPAVRRSILGALRHRTDARAFLTHEDAETWMDAVGPDGPWSPRGNRANDIQSLWHRQLLTGAWMARRFGDMKSAREWEGIARRLAVNFDSTFVDSTAGLIADHLKADGSRDSQVRPNQFFAFPMVSSRDLRDRIFRSTTEALVYPHGVASLSQDDPHFHPYHHHRPYYVQDAAYHNGIVWTWLAGPWISAAAELGYQDLAFQVTENMVHQILERGAVGTLSELLDAAPRPGEREPGLSGTFTQAWSLAEFIRVWYQDYLGIRVDVPAGQIVLRPRLPGEFGQASTAIRFGDHLLRLEIRSAGSRGTIDLESAAGTPQVQITGSWSVTEGVEQSFSTTLLPGLRTTLNFNGTTVTQNNGGRMHEVQTGRTEGGDSNVPPKLATPVVRPGLRSLQGPPHRILSSDEAVARNPDARLVFETADPEGDDVGTGTYIYPTSPHLKPGSLDLTHFRVTADDDRVYFRLRFRALSNPGWHPGYGFQLTYAAIAIDKDRIPGSGQRTLGMNSNVVLPASRAFETVIYVGGGFRVVDANGAIRAEYHPAQGDENNPLGSVATRSIEFSVPIDVLGRPEPAWQYSVFIGAQDDHGGAGIGEFRSVEAEAGEWVGGGKKNPRDPNVYDELHSKARAGK